MIIMKRVFAILIALSCMYLFVPIGFYLEQVVTSQLFSFLTFTALLVGIVVTFVPLIPTINRNSYDSFVWIAVLGVFCGILTGMIVQGMLVNYEIILLDIQLTYYSDVLNYDGIFSSIIYSPGRILVYLIVIRGVTLDFNKKEKSYTKLAQA